MLAPVLLNTRGCADLKLSFKDSSQSKMMRPKIVIRLATIVTYLPAIARLKEQQSSNKNRNISFTVATGTT